MENNIVYTAMITGLLDVAKNLGVPGKVVPVLAIGLGIGVSVATKGANVQNVLEGIVIGLSSVGLYSTSKTISPDNN